MFARIILAGLLLAVSISPAAFGYDYMDASVRATGMGGAYVAISNDPSGIFYNPAGLVQIDRYMGYAMYNRRSKFGYTADESPYGFVLSGAIPFSGGVVGVGFNESGSWADATQVVTHNTFALAFARPFSPLFALGGTFKYLFNTNYGNQTGIDFDLGAMFFATPQLNFGLAVQSVAGTDVIPDVPGGMFFYNRRQIKLGAAYSHQYGNYGTTFGADAVFKQKKEFVTDGNNLFNFGLEQSMAVGPAGNASFRVGYTGGKDYNQNISSYSVGVAYAFKTQGNLFRIDYSFQDYPFNTYESMVGDHRVSFTVGFGTPSTPQWAKTTSTPVVSRISKPAEVKREAAKTASTTSSKPDATKSSPSASNSTGNSTGSSAGSAAASNSWNWDDKSSTNSKSDNSNTNGFASNSNTTDAVNSRGNQTPGAANSSSSAPATTKTGTSTSDVSGKSSAVAGATGTNATGTSSATGSTTGANTSSSNNWSPAGNSANSPDWSATGKSTPTSTTPTATSPKNGNTPSTANSSSTASTTNQSVPKTNASKTGSTTSGTGTTASATPKTGSGAATDASNPTTLSLPANKVEPQTKKKVFGVDTPSTLVPFSSEPTKTEDKTKSNTNTSGKATSNTSSNGSSATASTNSPWKSPADTKREERLGDEMQKPAETALAQVYHETPAVAPVTGKSSEPITAPVPHKLVGFKVSANVETIQSHFTKTSSYMVNLKYDLGDKKTLVKDWKIVIARQDWSEYNDQKVEANAVRILDSRGIPPSGILWDGKDNGGNVVSSGKYYFTLVLNMVTGETYWSNWQTVNIK